MNHAEERQAEQGIARNPNLRMILQVLRRNAVERRSRCRRMRNSHFLRKSGRALGCSREPTPQSRKPIPPNPRPTTPPEISHARMLAFGRLLRAIDVSSPLKNADWSGS